MKLKLLIALLFLLMCKVSLNMIEPVTQPIKAHIGNTNKIYRCCPDKCYLLKSLTEQVPIKEVNRKEIYDNYDEGTIIFSIRYCSE